MTNRAFMAMLQDLHQKEIAKLTEKEKQYSNEKDRFHNINRIAMLQECKNAMSAWRLMHKQFIAMDDWLKNYEKRTDGVSLEEFRKYVEEYILDMRNYLAIIYGAIFEAVEPDE